MTAEVLFDVADGIAMITLNTPGHFNTVTGATLDARRATRHAPRDRNWLDDCYAV